MDLNGTFLWGCACYIAAGNGFIIIISAWRDWAVASLCHARLHASQQ